MTTRSPEPERGVLAIIGATGYTGRLVVETARAAGVPLRLVGRRRDALDELAHDDDQVAVADARDVDALREAFDGVFAVASTAGPFLETGYAPVEAAIDVGAHYLDITGEQEFARGIYEDFGARAANAGIVLLTAFGMDYVPGDFAAWLAAQALEPPLDELVVGYALAASPSRGSMKTGALIAGRPHVVLVDGRLVESSREAPARTLPFAAPFDSESCVEWGGTEPLTVPHHTKVREVRSFWRLPQAAGGKPPSAAGGADTPSGPTPQERANARVAVTAVARRGSESSTVKLAGSDPYGLTALIIVRGYEALRAGEARGRGALGPAEAFDVHTFLPRLAPLLSSAGD